VIVVGRDNIVSIISYLIMSPHASTPIVIGVGDFINRSKRVEDAIEPLQLMINAIEEAIEDTGLSESSVNSLRAAVDSLDVVRTWTWPYPDLPGLIAERLRINPSRKHYTDHGGNQPGVLFDEAARRISKGETKVAILTGGEALASCECTAPILLSRNLLQLPCQDTMISHSIRPADTT
jgi:hypothetical protein